MKALVVVDMQNDFINGSLGTPEAQAIVGKVVQKIKNFDGDAVMFTMDTHYGNYMDTQEGHMLPVPHCINGTQGHILQDDVYEQANKLCIRHDVVTSVFPKSTFGSIELGKWVSRIENLEEVIFVGLCTDICVISNALLVKAFLPEAKITVDAACCAGVTPESHINALRAMKMCQINIENWEE